MDERDLKVLLKSVSEELLLKCDEAILYKNCVVLETKNYTITVTNKVND